jgi:NAD(P) transhydrogenase subunit alpha
MRVGIPREIAPGERRVALVPEIITRLDGFDVAVERGAGDAAGFSDDAYAAAGATLVEDAWREVEAVAKVAKPSADELERLASGQLLIAFLTPLTDPDPTGSAAWRRRASSALRWSRFRARLEPRRWTHSPRRRRSRATRRC